MIALDVDYRQTNDVFTAKLYLQRYCYRVMLTEFFVRAQDQSGSKMAKYCHFGPILEQCNLQHDPMTTPLEMKLSFKNVICLPIKDACLTRLCRAFLKKQDCHALEKFKIEMGVAGTVFEPQSPNFVKIHIF